MLLLAQLIFSGPWENGTTSLLLQLYKTLPNLTLPDQSSIPFPNPAVGTHPSPAGNILPQPLTLKFNLLPDDFLRTSSKFGKNEFGTAKVQFCPTFFLFYTFWI